MRISGGTTPGTPGAYSSADTRPRFFPACARLAGPHWREKISRHLTSSHLRPRPLLGLAQADAEDRTLGGFHRLAATVHPFETHPARGALRRGLMTLTRWLSAHRRTRQPSPRAPSADPISSTEPASGTHRPQRPSIGWRRRANSNPRGGRGGKRPGPAGRRRAARAISKRNRVRSSNGVRAAPPRPEGLASLGVNRASVGLHRPPAHAAGKHRRIGPPVPVGPRLSPQVNRSDPPRLRSRPGAPRRPPPPVPGVFSSSESPAPAPRHRLRARCRAAHPPRMLSAGLPFSSPIKTPRPFHARLPSPPHSHFAGSRPPRPRRSAHAGPHRRHRRQPAPRPRHRRLHPRRSTRPRRRVLPYRRHSPRLAHRPRPRRAAHGRFQQLPPLPQQRPPERLRFRRRPRSCRRAGRLPAHRPRAPHPPPRLPQPRRHLRRRHRWRPRRRLHGPPPPHPRRRSHPRRPPRPHPRPRRHQPNEILLNDGNGRFPRDARCALPPKILGTRSSTVTLDTADFNADGAPVSRPCLLLSTTGGNELRVDARTLDDDGLPPAPASPHLRRRHLLCRHRRPRPPHQRRRPHPGPHRPRRPLRRLRRQRQRPEKIPRPRRRPHPRRLSRGRPPRFQGRLYARRHLRPRHRHLARGRPRDRTPPTLRLHRHRLRHSQHHRASPWSKSTNSSPARRTGSASGMDGKSRARNPLPFTCRPPAPPVAPAAFSPPTR